MTAFTDADKLACIERELKMRRRVYPNQIRLGRLSLTVAEHEIALMEAIRDDYRAKVQPSLLDAG